jgi:hypothetical protein
MIPLNPEEEQALAPILKKASERANYPIRLETLINRWDIFTRKVADGYQLTGYDYTNQLSGRDLLDTILSEVPVSLRDRLHHSYLDQADSRFRSASRPIVSTVF